MHTGKVCLLLAIVSVAAGAEWPADIDQDIRQGRWLQSQGRFAEAEKRFASALHAAEKLSGRPDIQVAAVSNLASIKIDLAQLDEAARLYERALRILITDGGKEDPRVGRVQVQLAELYLEAGQTATAEKLLNNAVKLLHQSTSSQPGASGEAGSDTAVALDVLACVYSHQGKQAAAEASEREALSIFQTASPPDPAYIAIANMHMAAFLNVQKRPEEALPYAASALEKFRALPVPQPGMEAAADITLASVYAQTKRESDAISVSQAAYRIVEDFYGPRHPKTALVLLSRAAILRTIGKKKEARLDQRQGEQILAENGQRGALETVPVQGLLPR
jgi:tetratricopeptide (TPR) repeat protein